MTRHRPWIGTSWKMNKQRADAVHFARTLAGHPHAQGSAVQPFVIPPFPYIALLKYVAGDAAANVIIAYEPVWSIGESGIPATPEFANEQHRKIASLVTSLTGMNVPILYGGSVNPGNCVALANQSHIDGLFIGRSAWNVEGYLSILTQVTESLT
jgi:triosephosphate isomerase